MGSVAWLHIADDFPRGANGASSGLWIFGERQDLVVREMTARADGLGGRQMRVGLNAGLGNTVTGAQMSNERLGRGDLAGGWRLFVEITDQADADSIFVDVVRAGVAAVHPLLLVVPPLSDFDLAVAAAVAVADDEVVAAAVDSEDLAVLGVDLVVAAARGGTVMQHDIPPGPIGLVGVDQLVGVRIIQEGLELVAQAGAANAAGAGAGDCAWCNGPVAPV